MSINAEVYRRRTAKPADSVQRYMGKYERETARVRTQEALAMGNLTLAVAGRIRDALNSAGIAFVRAVTLS